MKSFEKKDYEPIVMNDLAFVILGNLKKIILLTFIISVMSALYSLSLSNIYQSKAVYLLKEDIQFSSQQDLSGLVPFNLGSKDSYHMNYIKSVLSSRDFFETLYQDNNFMIYTQASSGFNEATQEIIINPELVNLIKLDWLNISGVSAKPKFEEAYKNFNNNFSSVIDVGEGKIVLTFNHFSPYYSKEALSIINNYFNSYVKNIKSHDVSERKFFLTNELNKASITYIKDNLSQLMLSEIEKQVFYSTSGNIYFDTIDKPSIGLRFAPKRALIVLYALILGLIFSSIFFIVITFIKQVKITTKD